MAVLWHIQERKYLLLKAWNINGLVHDTNNRQYLWPCVCFCLFCIQMKDISRYVNIYFVCMFFIWNTHSIYISNHFWLLIFQHDHSIRTVMHKKNELTSSCQYNKISDNDSVLYPMESLELTVNNEYSYYKIIYVM